VGEKEKPKTGGKEIMEKEITIMGEPEELLAWIGEHDLLMGIGLEDAKILLGYVEGHGYVIGTDENGALVRQDLCGDPEEIEAYSMDDLIDSVCEWNYSLILEMDNSRRNPENFLDFVQKQNKYEALKQDEKRLDQMFDKTIYGKEVGELAIKLAEQVIQSQKIKKEVEATPQVSEPSGAYFTDKKGR
jgi:hypothetical protein